MNFLAIFGIESVLGMAFAGAILGAIFAGIAQISKHRQAKRLKSGLDDLQKRIEQLPLNYTKEELDKALQDWETKS